MKRIAAMALVFVLLGSGTYATPSNNFHYRAERLAYGQLDRIAFCNTTGRSVGFLTTTTDTTGIVAILRSDLVNRTWTAEEYETPAQAVLASEKMAATEFSKACRD